MLYESEYYGICRLGSNTFKHHGIKGQKWGIRRYQNLDGSLTAEGYIHYGYGAPNENVYERMRVQHTPSYLDKKPVTAKRLKQHPIESINEMARLSQKDLRSLEKADKKHTERNPIRYNINTPDDELEAYQAGDKHAFDGRSYNCPNCAAAFEMVERGYSVSARPKQNGSNVENIEQFFVGGKLQHATSTKDFSKEYYDTYKELKKLEDKYYANSDPNKQSLWDDPKFIKVDDKMTKAYNDILEKSNKEIESAIKLQGKNARGIMVVGWQEAWNPSERTTAFHAFNYKVKKDGSVCYYDCQSHDPHDQNGAYDFHGYDPREVYIMRTDNLQLSQNIAKAVYSNRRAK